MPAKHAPDEPHRREIPEHFPGGHECLADHHRHRGHLGSPGVPGHRWNLDSHRFLNVATQPVAKRVHDAAESLLRLGEKLFSRAFAILGERGQHRQQLFREPGFKLSDLLGQVAGPGSRLRPERRGDLPHDSIAVRS